tara:strand:- start:575 stop:841 length:267 start_codon:yes stop_codon:yes gene_type:complete
MRLYHTNDNLKQVIGPEEALYNTENIWGNCTGLRGNAQNLTGDVSWLHGDISGLSGDATGSSSYYPPALYIGDIAVIMRASTPNAEIL